MGRGERGGLKGKRGVEGVNNTSVTVYCHPAIKPSTEGHPSPGRLWQGAPSNPQGRCVGKGLSVGQWGLTRAEGSPTESITRGGNAAPNIAASACFTSTDDRVTGESADGCGRTSSPEAPQPARDTGELICSAPHRWHQQGARWGEGHGMCIKDCCIMQEEQA